jgi:hypothetical protein
MGRISFSLIVLLGVLLWVGSSVEAASPRSGKNALVAGKVLVCGGGWRGPTRCFPPRRAVVSVLNAQHHLVARERATNGHFRFRLRPGRYQLRARWAGTEATGRVKAKAHCTVHTKLEIALH